MTESGTLTLLYTDLVSSTQHLQQAGDEAGDELFRVHHKFMSDAVAAGGGQELKWLGDGMLAAFPSAADAVRCAISVQQTAGRPSAGIRFEIRVGIHMGEVLRRDGGYFGTPVVVARQLCDRATSGQILCSRLIAELLASRQAFSFHDVGSIELKGGAASIAVCEVVYERNDPAVMLNRTPFVGRVRQLKRLAAQLEEARNGRGSIVMLRGEPGIGKTRTIDEFADQSRQQGVAILRGACYDGEWQPPFAPFAEAIAEYARHADAAEFAAVLGKRGSIIARIAPALRESLGEVTEPAALHKEDERFRLFDAVAQFLIALSHRTPLVLVLDDLHWADRGTVSMLSHVAHFVAANPILLLGAYRDAEVERKHPLTAALAGLSRVRNFESLTLSGLQSDELADLLGIIGDQAAPQALVKALGEATDGNPLFIRELLLDLFEKGEILREGKGWTSRLSIDQLGIPESVRQLIGRRVSRLSEKTSALLSVAAAFNGPFALEVAAAVAELDENAALSCIDEALEAKLLRPGPDAESFDFTHAIIRHTLYSELSSVRRVRMHRKIAEEMERAWGELAAHHAAEVAFQFWRGAAESGTGRGVDYALAAADNAEAAYGHDDVAAFLRIALELLPKDDARRPRILARLSFALTWSFNGPEALTIAHQAGDSIAASEGHDAAADYYEQIARAAFNASLTRSAWELAQEGLRYVGARRDITWASLTEIDINRAEAEDPANPGTSMDSPESRELCEVLRKLPPEQLRSRHLDPVHYTRAEITGDPAPVARLTMRGGDFRLALALWQQEGIEGERSGALARAVRAWAGVARCRAALGEFVETRAALDRAAALAARLGRTSFGTVSFLGARVELQMLLNEDWEQFFSNMTSSLGHPPESQISFVEALKAIGAEIKWTLSGATAYVACANAYLGQKDRALQYLNELPYAVENGAPWGVNYIPMTLLAANTLWLLNRTDHAEVIEQSIRRKILAPDLRWPALDARLELAHLGALQGRHEEAVEWFARARNVLEEAGARPLRAIADYDEALMYLRRHAADDADRACPLLEVAAQQFRSLEMTGWLKRADQGLASVNR